MPRKKRMENGKWKKFKNKKTVFFHEIIYLHVFVSNLFWPNFQKVPKINFHKLWVSNKERKKKIERRNNL